MKFFSNNKFEIIYADNQLNLTRVKKDFINLSKMNGFNGDPKDFLKVSAKDLNLFMKNMNRDMNDMTIKVLNSFYKSVNKLCGKYIAFQKNPYLRINCPHLDSTATIPHNDFEFGHSPFGFNIWIPLFDVEGKNGIYMVSEKDSLKIYKKFNYNQRLDEYIKNKKFKKNFFKLKFFDGLVFSNKNIHGAISDKNNRPRISLNMHFQSSNVPFGEKGAEFFNFGFFDKKNKIYKSLT